MALGRKQIFLRSILAFDANVNLHVHYRREGKASAPPLQKRWPIALSSSRTSPAPEDKLDFDLASIYFSTSFTLGSPRLQQMLHGGKHGPESAPSQP